jgi:hypothetical protein
LEVAFHDFVPAFGGVGSEPFGQELFGLSTDNEGGIPELGGVQNDTSFRVTLKGAMPGGFGFGCATLLVAGYGVSV